MDQGTGIPALPLILPGIVFGELAVGPQLDSHAGFIDCSQTYSVSSPGKAHAFAHRTIRGCIKFLCFFLGLLIHGLHLIHHCFHGVF